MPTPAEAVATINRVYREFKRYTGDGLPGEPTNAPLPIGDPSTHVHNANKAEIRAAHTQALLAADGSAIRAEAAAAISGEGVAIVSSRAAMAAINSGIKSVAFLKEGTRSGMFVWDASDCSADVANDSQQGCVVPRAGDATGATGAWRRIVATHADVKWWGAKGNGTDTPATCTTAFQQWAWFCGKYGVDPVISDATVDYPLSAKVQFKCTRNLAATDQTPASDVHFTDNLPFHIRGVGNARLRATAAMDAMFELIFDDGADADIGPFYTDIQNIQFDGASLATSGLSSNFTMHVSIRKCRFHGLTNGIKYTGYGVMDVSRCVFKCKYGVNLNGGGGDSLIQGNDFYYDQNNSAGVFLGALGGNIRISSNVFTDENQGTLATTYGVQAVGANASPEIRDLVIADNEFCGVTTAVRLDGTSSTNKNVWRNIIRGNHTSAFGTKNTGQLVAAVDCTDVLIEGNQGNSRNLSNASAIAIEMVRCNAPSILGNSFNNYMLAAISMTDCTDAFGCLNRFEDVGKTGAGYVCVAVIGAASARNVVKRNFFRQTSASYAQNGVYASSGATGTVASDNDMYNISVPYTV